MFLANQKEKGSFFYFENQFESANSIFSYAGEIKLLQESDEGQSHGKDNSSNSEKQPIFVGYKKKFGIIIYQLGVQK